MKSTEAWSATAAVMCLGLSAALVIGADQEAPGREEFRTNLKVLEGVGPTPEGHKVLHLHIEEETWHGFLGSFYQVDPDPRRLEPIWRF